MNTLVASTLNSFLFRRAQPGRWVGITRAIANTQQAAANAWAAETRPVVFRSEAFAEDLDDLEQPG